MPKPPELKQARDIPHEQVKTEPVAKETQNVSCAKWAKYKHKVEVRPETDGNFEFPDGGWVCSQCQNYNFAGRTKCNRCHKAKAKNDFNGKPKHLLRRSGKENEKPTHKQVIAQAKAEVTSIEELSRNVNIEWDTVLEPVKETTDELKKRRNKENDCPNL